MIILCYMVLTIYETSLYSSKPTEFDSLLIILPSPIGLFVSINSLGSTCLFFSILSSTVILNSFNLIPSIVLTDAIHRLCLCLDNHIHSLVDIYLYNIT